MNMFNTDSGFRPPSPLDLTAGPGSSLFGDPTIYEDFPPSNPDFLSMPMPPPPPLTNDPSSQLFNPSEQRYFSEFLDTLVVDQDFTFDPSSIPNLPTLPIFSTDNMPNFMDNQPQQQQYQYQQQQQQQHGMPFTNINSVNNSMDYDTAQSPYINNNNNNNSNSSSAPIKVPAKRKTSKASEAMAPPRADTSASTSTSGPSSLDAPTKITTPIQQLSKLTLENTHHLNGESNNSHPSPPASTMNTERPSKLKSKKNKRGDEPRSQPYPRSSSSTSLSSQSNLHSTDAQQRQKEDSREQNASMSDDYVSDAPSSAQAVTTSTSPSKDASTPKRKPYKELLTEEEKRANHIASEQKRRNTIRNGFKDMTDIIPDLKDINSSKSTILFRAVDFIKYLEKRNLALQEKADLLQSRLYQQQQAGGGRNMMKQGSLEHQRQPPPPAQYHHHLSHHNHNVNHNYNHGHPSHSPQQHHHQNSNGNSIHTHYHPSNNGVMEKLQDIPNFYPVS
ncbi:hypothetical protein BGZ94_002202 [Podila epigama]|nr:hypothetical protein BGZ94_002202 [Podila epigama]